MVPEANPDNIDEIMAKIGFISLLKLANGQMDSEEIARLTSDAVASYQPSKSNNSSLEDQTRVNTTEDTRFDPDVAVGREAKSDITLDEVIAKAGVAFLFELAVTSLSKEEMEQLFSIAMAGCNRTQQSKTSPQYQFNPNKRNQEGEHPN
jgi:hypothetical protein